MIERDESKQKGTEVMELPYGDNYMTQLEFDTAFLEQLYKLAQAMHVPKELLSIEKPE